MTVTAVRSAYRARSGRRRGGAYSGYLAAMTVLVVVLPILRALAVALGDPAVARAVAQVDLVGVVTVAAGAALPAAVLLGRARGPAVSAPYPTELLLATPVRRWLVLRRPVVASGAALLAVGVVAAVALAAVAGTSAVSAAAGAAAFAVLLTVAWLAGQCLTPSRSAALAGGLAVPVIAALLTGVGSATPGGLLALALAGAPTAAPSAAIASVALAALVLPAAPRLVDAASGPALIAQSHRWASARRTAAIGEVGDALGGYRALPTRGRSLSAVRLAPFPLAVVVRDAVGAVRTPGRSISACAALLAAGSLVAVAVVVPASLLVLPAVAAGVLAYLGAGVWSDGFRHAAATAGQTAFVAPPPFELLLVHAVLPLTLSIALAVSGFLLAGVLLPGSAAVPAVAIAVTAVAARAMDATRGALPPLLLGPIPLPIGDGAGAAVLLWNLAGALVTAGAAAAVVASPVLLAGVPLLVLACLAVARGRLARA